MTEFVKTVAANDFQGFKRLFDSGAELSIGKWDGATTSGWKSIEALSNPGRQTRVLAAYEASVPKSVDLDVVDFRSDRKVIRFERSLGYLNKVAAQQLKLEAYGP